MKRAGTTAARQRSRPRRLLVALALLASVGCQAPGETTDALAWQEPVRQLEQALAEGNVSRAVRALHDADVAARRSRGWQPVVAVGDAYRRVGQTAGYREHGRARELYLLGFVRASQASSVPGILRVAAAFAALDDHEMVEQCVRAARAVAQAQRDPVGLGLVNAFHADWSRARRAARALRSG